MIPLTLLFFAQKRNLLIPLELSRVMHQGTGLRGFAGTGVTRDFAKRADRASYSVFVSNLDFRGTRLPQIGERALTGRPCGRREKRPVIRKKENRPEAADHVRSKTRNQHWIDFLRSTTVPPEVWNRLGTKLLSKAAVRRRPQRGHQLLGEHQLAVCTEHGEGSAADSG